MPLKIDIYRLSLLVQKAFNSTSLTNVKLGCEIEYEHEYATFPFRVLGIESTDFTCMDALHIKQMLVFSRP